MPVSWVSVLLVLGALGSANADNLLRIRNPNTTSPSEQYSGLVEVFHNSVWGTVCSTGWTFENSFLACRTAGFSSAVRGLIEGNHFFGPGLGNVLLGNVRCFGNESSFFDCRHDAWGSVSRQCSGHQYDAGVVCSDDTAVRLVGGSELSEGRVEVYHSGSWGTVCDDFWDSRDATVVCHQLGYPAALEAVSNSRFGPGSGNIWMDNLHCTGNESHIGDCSFNGWGAHNCRHYEDAGVRCADATFHGEYLPIRLVNGTLNSNTTRLAYGNVEIFFNDTWGTVCDDSWGIEDAQVACLQLGFIGAVIATSRSVFGRGSNSQPIYLDQVTCSGNEPAISECHHRAIGGYDCSHYEDAGVICQNGTIMPPIVRLVNETHGTGPEVSFGRVEVKYNGVWGSICDDFWDINDARVICRMLNFTDAIRASRGAYRFRGAGIIWLDNVQCQGNETNIQDCSFPGWGIHNCYHFEDALVACDSVIPGDPLRLVGGATSAEGRLEILHNNVWGTVCDDLWDNLDATVVCQQLGFYGDATALTASQFGSALSSQRIWLDNVRCIGNESFLSDCSANSWGVHNCGHHEDAGVVCSDSDFTIPVRLANGTSPNNGRVEILVNNRWGTICDFGWDLRDATVICRQLGFSGASQATNNAFYGTGSPLMIVTSYIYCRGTEAQIYNCSGMHPNVRTPSSYCRTTDIAGVKCIVPLDVPPPIRLVGGTSQYEGRVEVLMQGVWGTICDDRWSNLDAQVVCRQLGYPSTGALGLSYSRYGHGVGPIVLDDVVCGGLEVYITDCNNSGFYLHNCNHAEDASVRCIVPNGGSAINNQVRLVTNNGTLVGVNEGTVEIQYNGTWGTVCDDFWGYSEAQVVCRMLGFTTAIRSWIRAHFGPAQGSIVLDNVRCAGNEIELSDCSHLPFGQHDCVHSEDAGVSCSNYTTPRFPVRLRGSRQPHQGRVEIQFNGTWGTVCDDQWDIADGNVVCQQLGYRVATRVTNRASFGRGRGPIWLDNVNCNGLENSLSECDHNGWGVNNCEHREDAGVVCEGELLPIRLVNGSVPSEGRVEVYYNNTWGTICDDFWGIRDAQVVCTQLGYTIARAPYSRAHFGQGTGPIYLDDVACIGTETDIFFCSNKGIGTHNCAHSEDAGVACGNDSSTDHITFRVRLVGGRNISEGRVEITRNGTWGTVCDDSWTIENADVVCRQLGFDRATAAYSNAYYGSGIGPIYLDDVACFGTEARLDQCYASEWNVHNCQHSEDAGVRCYVPHELVRLVGGESPEEGRVEVFHAGVWGTVCQTHWNINDANVICRELGYARALSAPGFATFNNGTNAGQIWLTNVNCTGTEDSIFQCEKSDWGNVGTCGHSNDASVLCTSIPINPYPVRLEGGSNLMEGRVEIYYNGKWGTICDDHWTMSEANIVCNQLGFPGAQFALGNSRFGLGSGLIWLDDVYCNGSEYFIHQCKHNHFGENNCVHSEDASVICFSAGLDIRLAGNSTSFSGRVEVNYNSRGWGTICDDLWSLNDADVACRMLGFKSASADPGRANFGEGNGTIWLDDVICLGNETTLLDCSHSGFHVHNCRHSEDAGVVCSNAAICPLFSQDNGNFNITSNNSSTRYMQGANVFVKCLSGYSALHGVTSITCSANGVWLPNIPGCDVACPALTLPSHLSSSSDIMAPRTVVTLSCDANYFLEGAKSIACLTGGVWSADLPSCRQQHCPAISNGAHVISFGHGGDFPGSSVIYTCDFGFQLIGKPLLICNTDATWSAEPPKCVSNSTNLGGCNSTILSVNLNASTSYANIGDYVLFHCMNGYLLEGAGALICDANNTWSGLFPACVTRRGRATSAPATKSKTPFIAIGVVLAIVCVVISMVVTVFVVWKVAMYVNRKRAYGHLSVRAHVGDDARVNLFSDKDDEDDEIAEEPLYTSDDRPLNL